MKHRMITLPDLVIVLLLAMYMGVLFITRTLKDKKVRLQPLYQILRFFIYNIFRYNTTLVTTLNAMIIICNYLSYMLSAKYTQK